MYMKIYINQEYWKKKAEKTKVSNTHKSNYKIMK